MCFLYSTILALSSLVVSAGNNQVSVADTIKEMCKGMPEGTYTLSITRSEFSTPDNDGREIRNQLDFSPETYIFLRQTIKSNDERLLDYYCLSDSSENRINSNGEISPFETEQTISGRMEGGSKKLHGFNLKIMVPSIGEIYENHVEGRHFNISGLDFVDGTTFTLQALKSNDKEGSLRLYIDESEFPNISVKGYHYKGRETGLSESASDHLKKKSRFADIINAIELPDVVVRERRVKPIYYRSLIPDRNILEDDPILEMSHTMDQVVSRFGLRRGMGKVHMEPGDLASEVIEIEGYGRVINGEFVISEVILDEHLIGGFDISEVVYFDPANIKQIGYFLPSNYESFGNLAGRGGPPIKGLYGEASIRGLLIIWLKSPTDFSRFKRNRPVSLLNVSPFGYKTPMEFSVRDMTLYNSTLYWEPNFIPSKYNSNSLKGFDLPYPMNISIKIEGISDKGELICNRKEIAHEN